MVLCTIAFIVFNLILLPFAYLKGILIKFQFIFNKKIETKLKVRMLSFIVFLFFGWAIVFLNMCVDVGIFVMHLYQPTIRYRKEKSKVQFVSSKTFNALLKRFENDSKNGLEVFNFMDFSVYTREIMNIMPLLHDLIFASGKEGMTIDQQIFLLKEYGRVKNTLQNGSITYGSQQLIFTNIWKHIMKELKVNARIRMILRNIIRKHKVQHHHNVIETSFESDKDKEHLSNFLNICTGEIHDAVSATKHSEITLENIKEVFETVLFEKSEEGKLIKAKEEFKSPFRRTTTLLSQQSNRWNVEDGKIVKPPRSRMNMINRSFSEISQDYKED